MTDITRYAAAIFNRNPGMAEDHAWQIAEHILGRVPSSKIARDSAAWRMGLSAAKLRSLAPIRDGQGRIIGVTEKRRAAASAAELRAALRAIAPNHPLLQAA